METPAKEEGTARTKPGVRPRPRNNRGGRTLQTRRVCRGMELDVERAMPAQRAAIGPEVTRFGRHGRRAGVPHRFIGRNDNQRREHHRRNVGHFRRRRRTALAQRKPRRIGAADARGADLASPGRQGLLIGAVLMLRFVRAGRSAPAPAARIFRGRRLDRLVAGVTHHGRGAAATDRRPDADEQSNQNAQERVPHRNREVYARDYVSLHRGSEFIRTAGVVIGALGRGARRNLSPSRPPGPGRTPSRRSFGSAARDARPRRASPATLRRSFR